MSMIQKGNRKLPKSTGIFNLPEVKTCIGSTEWCRKNCYAKKASRMYKQVSIYRERMYQESLKDTFVDNINKDISKLSVIRIHESGDFYNQEYLNKWIEIANRNKDKIFYAYTKAFSLDYSKKPSNFIVRGSIDPTSTKENIEKANRLDGLAICVDNKTENREGVFTCTGSCKTCDYCLKPGPVLFHKH